MSTEPKKNDDPEQIKRWLEAGRYDISWPATKEQIKGIFKSRGGQTHKPAQDDDMTVALHRRFVVEQPPETRTKGQKHIKFILNPEYFPEKKDPFEEAMDLGDDLWKK